MFPVVKIDIVQRAKQLIIVSYYSALQRAKQLIIVLYFRALQRGKIK